MASTNDYYPLEQAPTEEAATHFGNVENAHRSSHPSPSSRQKTPFPVFVALSLHPRWLIAAPSPEARSLSYGSFSYASKLTAIHLTLK